MIPTGGQDYFIGVVHAHALVTIWMNLYVERNDEWRENSLDEGNQERENSGLRELLGASEP